MAWPRIYLALVLSLATVAHADPMPSPQVDVLEQIDGLVRARFYDPALLPRRGWDQAVRETRAVLATAPADRRREILARLVARLQTSHTEYIAPDDPRYAQTSPCRPTSATRPGAISSSTRSPRAEVHRVSRTTSPTRCRPGLTLERGATRSARACLAHCIAPVDVWRGPLESRGKPLGCARDLVSERQPPRPTQRLR